MHFINKDSFPESPIALLAKLNIEHRPDWKLYNQARLSKEKPLPKKPVAAWLNEGIRLPLKKLFLKNCGYCGIHSDTGHDAEVDHHFPISKDVEGDFIFDWDNYVWSCHSCNSMKRSKYPLLNPCSANEMSNLFFHSTDGRYLCDSLAPKELKIKLQFTIQHTNINGKNRPARRRLIYRNLNENHLSGLKIAYDLYLVECDANGPYSEEALTKLNYFEEKKDRLLELIKSGDYLHLIKHTINTFLKETYKNLPFTFDQLLEESKYLDE
ncbi:MAG: hypothetical protein HEP71_06660 [Roseivirga sp.]|nr:hypothetical protein [Roseivirga sp.]